MVHQKQEPIIESDQLNLHLRGQNLPIYYLYTTHFKFKIPAIKCKFREDDIPAYLVVFFLPLPDCAEEGGNT